MQKQKKYQLFDGTDERFPLVVASNANIRKVCKVLTQSHNLPDQARVYYAKHGDIAPEKAEEGQQPTYTFDNVYNEATMWVALAKVLFFEGPLLLETDDDGGAFVPEENQEQSDKLIRSEIMRGRDDFLGSFGANPYEVRKLLSALENAPITPITSDLRQALEMAETMDAAPTSAT